MIVSCPMSHLLYRVPYGGTSPGCTVPLERVRAWSSHTWQSGEKSVINRGALLNSKKEKQMEKRVLDYPIIRYTSVTRIGPSVLWFTGLKDSNDQSDIYINMSYAVTTLITTQSIGWMLAINTTDGMKWSIVCEQKDAKKIVESAIKKEEMH